MKDNSGNETLLQKSIRLITGAGESDPDVSPLGGVRWEVETLADLPKALSNLFLPLLPDGNEGEELKTLLKKEIEEAEECFNNFYGKSAPLIPEDPEEAAKTLSEIWAPETGMDADDILKRWKLNDVHKNQTPITPEQLVIQLNGLYSLPEETIPEQMTKMWTQLEKEGFTHIADYDHPVPLFCSEANHELVKCLIEMDSDMEFEKEKNILPPDFLVPVLISISVTHLELTGITGIWLKEILAKLKLNHIKPLILTEVEIDEIKRELYTKGNPVYTVTGKYANHFNALKYTQLILEKGWGVQAGFKLDTDEGMRSRDLFHATGKTWMETLCHPYWGGRARDWKGKKYFLDINEGEYIDSRDIDKLGYTGSLREPDIKLPPSRRGKELFFNKIFAHGGATALYNKFDVIEDFISHPVVKGGGYGITNEGLKRAVPFTYSRVGRAEDQMYYFSALARGVRGIFHPDLRIAHYKSSVAASEDKTEGSRFIGDMYRIILFKYLADELGIKELIDPMPGVFAGPLARAQAVFNMLYRVSHYQNEGKTEVAGEILRRGIVELRELKKDIDSGCVRTELAKEYRNWLHFIKETEELEEAKVRSVLEKVFS
ncbi:MAG: hypothetical protein JEY99_10945 [Spirochaetales bacterium]|nr:hypothetical protein [Spirochaetales bacterium]